MDKHQNIASNLTIPVVDRSFVRTTLFALTLSLTALIVYWPALNAGYIWDDPQYLLTNQLVQRWDGLSWIWQIRLDPQDDTIRINTPQYYPLVYTSFWLEHKLWGLKPLGYHAVNVGLHLCSALLLWGLLRRLKVPGGWFIAAVFALHPVQVESVAWVTERKNILSGFFYMLALHAALRYADGGRKFFYFGGLIALAAALLSKTVTCSLPVAFLLIQWYRHRRFVRRDWMFVAPALAIGLVAGLFTAYIEKTHVGTVFIDWGVGLPERALIVAPSTYWFYAGKILWPHPLIFIYPRWHIEAGNWLWYLPLAGTLATIVISIVMIRRWGWAPLLLLLFSAATLFPALGLFEVYPHRFSWVADHFQYLGGIGFVMLFTIAAVTIGRRLFTKNVREKTGVVLGIGILAVLSVLTYRQCRSYQNEERLWKDTLAANPGAWIASLNLALGAADRGDYATAADYFEQAARDDAIRGDVYGNWGMILLRLGRLEGAIAKFEQALAIRPSDSSARAGLGVAYKQLRRMQDAERELEEAVTTDPSNVMARMNLFLLYVGQNRYDAAESCIIEGLRQVPASDDFRSYYAGVLTKTGRWEEAAREYELISPSYRLADGIWEDYVRALCHTDRYGEAVRALDMLLSQRPNDGRVIRFKAMLRATCPGDSVRDGAEALRLARRLAQMEPNRPRTSIALACAQAETRDFAGALNTVEEAIVQADRAGDTESKLLLTELREQFEKQEAFRTISP